MEAGRELDALIFQHIFQNEKGYVDYLMSKDGEWGRSLIRNYSINMEDAWLVINKLEEQGFFYESYRRDLPHDKIMRHWWRFIKSNFHMNYVSSKESAPHAICLAALEVIFKLQGNITI